MLLRLQLYKWGRYAARLIVDGGKTGSEFMQLGHQSSCIRLPLMYSLNILLPVQQYIQAVHQWQPDTALLLTQLHEHLSCLDQSYNLGQ